MVFSNADAAVVRVAGMFNGPLACDLVRMSSFHDVECTNLMRCGGDVVGKLVDSGSGRQAEFREAKSVHDLSQNCGENNRKLVAALKEEEHACELFAEMNAEAAIGRMTSPINIDHLDLDRSVVARRFSVEQGVKADGSKKIRSVDDETACGTNACVSPCEKLSCDGVDVRAALASCMYISGCRNLSLWKADVRSAYRRIPVNPCQRWLLWVALMVRGEVFVAQHNAMPFGCTGWSHVNTGSVLLPFLILLQAVCMHGTESATCSRGWQ